MAKNGLPMVTPVFIIVPYKSCFLRSFLLIKVKISHHPFSLNLIRRWPPNGKTARSLTLALAEKR